MFHTIIVQPISNLLVAIYGLLPGNDLGISLVLFTVLVRLAMWPLLKRQLHQSKLMREMQPELKKIKQSAAGDRQKEAALMMELYRERGVSPFSSIALTLVQLPIFLGVFSAARNLTEHLDKLGSLTYSFVADIPHIAEVIKQPQTLDFVSLGFLDLSRKVYTGGRFYWPVLVLGLLAIYLQFVQSKQLLPQPKSRAKLRDLFRESATSGKQPASEDLSAAMSGSMLYLMPLMTGMFVFYSSGAMIIYLLASSVVGLVQQRRIFKTDTNEMQALAEVVSVKKTPVKASSGITKAANVKASATAKPGSTVVRKTGRVTTKSRIIKG